MLTLILLLGVYLGYQEIQKLQLKVNQNEYLIDELVTKFNNLEPIRSPKQEDLNGFEMITSYFKP